MRRIGTLVLGLMVLLSGAPMERLVGETEVDHHEHAGLPDAAEGQTGHHHGDQDDHHQNPDDSCHHHIDHCCCSHVHAYDSGILASTLAIGNSERVVLPTFRRGMNPYARPPFHVPIS